MNQNNGGFFRLLLVNSIAVWSLIAAGFDVALGFGWVTLTLAQVTLLHSFYIALVMTFRQFFSITGGDNVEQSLGDVHVPGSVESMTAGTYATNVPHEPNLNVAPSWESIDSITKGDNPPAGPNPNQVSH